MDIKEIRRLNLQALVDQYGAVVLAEKVGSADTHLRNVINKVKTEKGTERGVGEKLARKIEQALELEHGWMDQYHPTASDAAAEQKLLESYRNARELRPLILDHAQRIEEHARRLSDGEISPPDLPPGAEEITPAAVKKSKLRK